MSNEDGWIKEMNECVKGRTIVGVRIMTKEEAEEQLGWYSRAVVLVLDDGNLLFPSADDEGNNAGALFTTFEGCPTFPVFG